MTSKQTIKVIKREHRLRTVDEAPDITKTANQLRREMVQTVANWIAETQEGLTLQRSRYRQFREAAIEAIEVAVSETATKV